MMKNILMCAFLFLLSGCVGDRIDFHNEVDAAVTENYICIKSFPGDTLEYYLLSSSADRYTVPLAYMMKGVPKKYPDTCIPVSLKKKADYELIYTLNGINYHFDFSIDADKKIKKDK